MTTTAALPVPEITDDDTDYEISFSATESLFDDDACDPMMFTHAITGEIMANAEPIGEMQALLVNIGEGVNAGFTPHTIIDAIDCNLYDAGSVLFDEDGTTKLAKRYFPYSGLSDTLLILQRMTIAPAFRSRGLGLLAAKAAIRLFTSMQTIVLLRPFPLQFEQNADASDEEIDAATKKLKNYWMRLGGFKALGTTGYLGRDMQMLVKPKTRKAVV